ncbi:MAG: DUF167 domain-containing protein [Nanoarchaeota archaeon]
MNLHPKFNSKDIIDIKAKPNSSKSQIKWEDNKFIVNLISIPDNNKANEELIKLFKKQLNLRVKIIKGFKSKNKKIEIL